MTRFQDRVKFAIDRAVQRYGQPVTFTDTLNTPGLEVRAIKETCDYQENDTVGVGRRFVRAVTWLLTDESAERLRTRYGSLDGLYVDDGQHRYRSSTTRPESNISNWSGTGIYSTELPDN